MRDDLDPFQRPRTTDEQERLAREVTTPVRVFASVPAAVIAYATTRSRKESAQALSFLAGPGGTDEHRRARAARTFAALSDCTVPIAMWPAHQFDGRPVDAEFGESLVASWPERPPGALARRIEAARRIAELCAWYLCAIEIDQSGRRDRSVAQINMAERLGMEPDALESVQRYTARVLRRRMVAKRLLEER